MANRWGLSDRESAFCRYFLASANATQSAIRAGYSTRGASVQAVRLMRRPAVSDEIARLRQAATDAVSGLLVPSLADPNLPDANQPETKAQVDRAYVLSKLIRNLHVSMGEEYVKITRVSTRSDGGQRYKDERILKPDAAAANRAAELLLKHLPQETNPIGQGPDQVDPQVMAVIQGFRGVVMAYKERTKDKVIDGDTVQKDNGKRPRPADDRSAEPSQS